MLSSSFLRLNPWYLVFGANTDVGKTLITKGLLASASRMIPKTQRFGYIKPLQTGTDQGHSDEKTIMLDNNGSNFESKTLYAWGPAVSPHVAVIGNENIPSDEKVCQDLIGWINKNEDCRFGLVESAGGVLSPGPNKTPQADMYRDLGLKVLMIGDGKLGGISTTMTAIESLLVRGYDVSHIAFIRDENTISLGNVEYCQEFYQNMNIKVHSFDNVPTDINVKLDDWYVSNEEKFDDLLKSLLL